MTSRDVISVMARDPLQRGMNSRSMSRFDLLALSLLWLCPGRGPITARRMKSLRDSLRTSSRAASPPRAAPFLPLPSGRSPRSIISSHCRALSRASASLTRAPPCPADGGSDRAAPLVLVAGVEDEAALPAPVGELGRRGPGPRRIRSPGSACQVRPSFSSARPIAQIGELWYPYSLRGYAGLYETRKSCRVAPRYSKLRRCRIKSKRCQL